MVNHRKSLSLMRLAAVLGVAIAAIGLLLPAGVSAQSPLGFTPTPTETPTPTLTPEPPSPTPSLTPTLPPPTEPPPPASPTPTRPQTPPTEPTATPTVEPTPPFLPPTGARETTQRTLIVAAGALMLVSALLLLSLQKARA